MSKPQLNQYLKLDSKRHQSYHIDEQGFQASKHLPRSPLLTADILEGFPIPPTTTGRGSPLSPNRNSPSPPKDTWNSRSLKNAVPANPPRALPSLPTNLLSSSLPEVDIIQSPMFPPRRKSSVAEQEIPYHPSFSPTFSETSSTSNSSSYFPPMPQLNSTVKRPTLIPLYFPPRRMSIPASPSPPPQVALPIIPNFVSVFVDPSTKFAFGSLSPLNLRPPRSPAAESIASEHSILEIKAPVVNLEKGKSKGIPMRAYHSGENKSSLVGKNPFDDQASVIDDIDWKEGKKRRGKNASIVSKWSFGGGNSHSTGVRNGISEWNTLGLEKIQKEEDHSRNENISTKSTADDFPRKINSSSTLPVTLRKRILEKPWLLILIVLVIIATVAGSSIAIHLNRLQLYSSTIGNCSCENDGQAEVTSEGVCNCLCQDIWSGTFCQYNSTCVTPIASNYSIAQGLLDVAVSANTFFSPPINSSRLALVVNNYLNLSIGTSQCRTQLSIISIPSLPPSQFSRRAIWSSAAILWTIANTEMPAHNLLNFISSKNFSQFGDFPASSSNVDFQFLDQGYLFDFSTLQLSVPAVSWTTIASPVLSQSSTMSNTSTQSKALDTMYSHALASSTQRNLSLIHYWNELKLAPGDLERFINAVKLAPVIVPIDATSIVAGLGLMDLALAQSKTSSFPPAIACTSAGLNRAQVGLINSVEVGFFGLGALSTSETANTTCLDRPIYGMLNLLSLRLPFVDSDPRSVPTQGLVLQESTKSRMIIHPGELLLGVSTSARSPSPSVPSFPDHFGTFSNLESVIFEYLQLLSPPLAIELVNFVLSQTIPSLPPTINSTLYQISNKLLSLPLLEVTIFGGLRYSDIDHSISSLSSNTKDQPIQFFGTSSAQQFRTWALAGPKSIAGGTNLQGPIHWSRGALEIFPVKEDSLTNVGFERIWNDSIGVAKNDLWAQLQVLGV